VVPTGVFTFSKERGAAALGCVRRRGRLRHTLLSLAALILVATSALPARAQSPGPLFNDAASAYQRGRFDSAAAGFQKLVRMGADDARVWYNLGNTQYKMGQIGHALVSYYRARRIDPRDADINANIRYVRLFAADKMEPVGDFFLEQWWQALVRPMSVYETRWLAALFFWIAAGLTVWRLWPQARRSIPPRLILAVWCVWLLTTGAAATCYVRDTVTRSGAVIATQTNVRGGPGDEYALQFVAHDGLMGTIERTESGWHLVRFPNGAKGWLMTADFEII
jgi:tetratricopeptide (TPR) repeat protein